MATGSMGPLPHFPQRLPAMNGQETTVIKPVYPSRPNYRVLTYQLVVYFADLRDFA